MVDVRVHIGEEPVFIRGGHIPSSSGCFFGEPNAHDALDVLEPVLPWHHQPQRRAVLVWQHLAVKAHGQDGERVHGFIHTQAFAVRPVQHSAALAGHLRRVHERGELHELRARVGREALQQIAEREADPRNDHRPRFYATEAIDAVFQRVGLDERIEVVGAWLVAFAVDGHLPRTRLQCVGVSGRVRFVQPELVEVVVARNVRVTVGSFSGAVWRRARHELGATGTCCRTY